MIASPNASDVPREGDIIAGKYRIERVLGAGGMGIVVAAQHVRLDEKVALKFLLPNALMNSEVIGRFEREARAASKIKNEHVARVSDVGTLDNGSPYMVMEYLQGGDLSGWLAERGPLAPELAVDFVLQACEAVGEAHSLGIVHRDLKPANLFCIQRTDGQLFIKVLDFGISKLTTPGTDSHMTRTTAFLGSPLYMSPEQMQTSKGVDARTDIWSLGVILFELITGKAPFDAESVTELAIKIAVEPPTMLRTLMPQAPPGLEAVLARCLEKDRARRFQSVGEMALALQPFAPPHARLSVERIVGTERRAGMTSTGGPPQTVVPGGVQPVPAQTHAPATAASWGQTGDTAPARGSGAGLAVALGVVTLALLLVGGGLFYRARMAPSGTAVGTATSTAPSSAPPPIAAPAPPPAVVVNRVPAQPPSDVPAVASPAPQQDVPAAPSARVPTRVAPSPASAAASHALPPAASTPPATSSKPAARPDCSTPYVINAAGEHQYKPECL